MSASMDRITVGCDSGNYSSGGDRDYASYNLRDVENGPDRIIVGNGNSSTNRTADAYTNAVATSRTGSTRDTSYSLADFTWSILKFFGAESGHNSEQKTNSDKALAFAHIEISIERPAEDLRPDIYSPNTTIV